MLDARLQVCKRAFGSSEVDQAVGVGKRIKVVADQYAGVAPKQGASILPQGRGPAAIPGNRELQFGALCNGLNQHAAHTAVRAIAGKPHSFTLACSISRVYARYSSTLI